jgi:hypothetical protein
MFVPGMPIRLPNGQVVFGNAPPGQIPPQNLPPPQHFDSTPIARYPQVHPNQQVLGMPSQPMHFPGMPSQPMHFPGMPNQPIQHMQGMPGQSTHFPGMPNQPMHFPGMPNQPIQHMQGMPGQSTHFSGMQFGQPIPYMPDQGMQHPMPTSMCSQLNSDGNPYQHQTIVRERR